MGSQYPFLPYLSPHSNLPNNTHYTHPHLHLHHHPHHIPETIALFDSERFAFIRDLVDLLSVQSALLITLRQALAKQAVVATVAQESEMLGRLTVLLQVLEMLPL